MNLSTIAEAASAARELRDLEVRKEALDKMMVVAVSIGTRADDRTPVELRKDGPCGTGTISGIGFPADLQALLTETVRGWVDLKIAQTKKELADMGVNIAA